MSRYNVCTIMNTWLSLPYSIGYWYMQHQNKKYIEKKAQKIQYFYVLMITYQIIGLFTHYPDSHRRCVMWDISFNIWGTLLNSKYDYKCGHRNDKLGFRNSGNRCFYSTFVDDHNQYAHMQLQCPYWKELPFK